MAFVTYSCHVWYSHCVHLRVVCRKCACSFVADPRGGDCLQLMFDAMKIKVFDLKPGDWAACLVS